MQGPSAEELLAHAGFVRRIAEGLLRDPNDVDDVVQDAYVAALRAPPPHGLRSWLAAVARNAARMRLRASRRRIAHELAAARPEATGATADAAGRMEIHRRLVEEVLALDEPTRTIVVLRYLDDVPPRVIAVRLKLPLDTVRSRLRRGLGRLRGRLDAWRGGDRAAWTVVLLPALRDGKAAALITGGAVVGKKTAAVFVVWAALATGLYVREAASERAPVSRAATDRAPLPDVPPEPPAPERTLTATEERQAFEQRWMGSRVGTVRGGVIDSRARAPLAAAVRLRLKGTLPDGATVEHETTTAPDGTFVVPGLRYPLEYEIRCVAEAEGVDARTSLWVGEETDVLQVGVGRERLLAGEVVDSSGLPIPGATVCHGLGPLRLEVARSDAEGKYRIVLREPPTEGTRLRVAAAAPGYRPSAGEVEQVAPQLWRARLTLRPGGKVLVKLLRRDGRPAEGADATLIVERLFPEGSVPDEPAQDVRDLMWASRGGDRRGALHVESTSVGAAAGPDGSVALWLPFAPERAWLVVQNDGCRDIHEIEGVASQPDGTFDLGEVTLPEPSFLRMRFVTTDGKPSKGLEVNVEDAAPMTILLRRCGASKTDDEGWAQVPNVTAGRKYRAWATTGSVGALMADEFVAAEGESVTLTRR